MKFNPATPSRTNYSTPYAAADSASNPATSSSSNTKSSPNPKAAWSTWPPSIPPKNPSLALDPRVIELALRESRAVIRRKNGVLITETHHGFLCANSGIDVSNVNGGAHALLLPENPDRSAANLKRALKRLTGISVPVIITDSFGRPWREGLTEFAIGIAGMKPLRDDRGRRDPHGYELKASVEAVADELACAAGLVCGKLNRAPACIVRGFRYEPGSGSVRELLRPAATDLFR
jgi:coenzyme F420-0:L-glutamate ligase/coenzyme F420-1:gamma-L-glutamate ligase